jgi:hypothetical protein
VVGELGKTSWRWGGASCGWLKVMDDKNGTCGCLLRLCWSDAIE